MQAIGVPCISLYVGNVLLDCSNGQICGSVLIYVFGLYKYDVNTTANQETIRKCSVLI
jgi:hypothetical protein